MKQFKNILFVNEPGAEQSSAIERVVSLAEHNQAGLAIIDVIPQVQGESREDRTEKHFRKLDGLVASFKQRLSIDIHVVEGTVFLEVVRAVLRNGHDLVIKPAENPDFLKQLFGSDDMHLLRKCPCPVWLMKLPEKKKYDCILAAVGFNPLRPERQAQELNTNILEIAGSLAVSDAAVLHVVHAWEAYAETALRFIDDAPDKHIADHVNKQNMLHYKELSQLWEITRERMEGLDSLSPKLHLPRGSAKKIIPRLAENLRADLIVMGTIARTGISGLFIGNTAETILYQTPCSVFAIKPSNFKTPVDSDISGR